MDIIIPSTDAVKINVSNSQNDFVSFEKKYQKSLTISDLKVSHSKFCMQKTNPIRFEFGLFPIQ